MEDNFREYKLKILGDIKANNTALIKLQDIVSTVATEVTKLKTAYTIISGVVVALVIAIVIERLIK